MDTTPPKFRADLIVSKIVRSDAIHYVIKDPVTKRFFRFKEPEYFIAQQLDGSTRPADIRRSFVEEFEADLSADTLDRFIDRLRELRLVEGESTGREARDALLTRNGGRRRLSRILYLRFKAVDPDHFFDRLVPRIGFFFTRRFVLLAVVVTLLAVAIVAGNWDDYTAQVREIIVPRSIVTFFLVVFLVTCLHEVAHGVTCKHFGGRVHEMGFMLIYFLPAFYSNVSDAWLFEEKRQRLWVSFAGVFFQVFVWSLAVLVWRVIDMETWLSEVCCITIATSGLTAIFNFNPLIKLDGYYLLSDLLDCPNLRGEAFRFIGGRVKRLFGLEGGRSGNVARRERRIYLLYGVTAAAYSIGLLAFIAVAFARYVFMKFHATGLILLFGILVLVFTGSGEWWRTGVQSLFGDGGASVMNRRRRIGWWIAIAVVVAILVFGVWELKISGRFELLPSSRAHVRTEVAGTIKELYVDEGAAVRRGQLIARLDDTELRAEIASAEAELAKRRAELELLESGPLREEVERQQKIVEREQTRVLYAEKELARISELHERNLVSPGEYEKAREDLDVLNKELERAESDLAVLLKGTRPETIRAARFEIERLEASLAYLTEQLSRTEIRSPIAGIVTTHHLLDRRSEHVDVGEEICRIADCDTMLLEIRVSEQDVADVAVGQQVKLKVRPLPAKAFYGTVSAIAPIATHNSSRTIVVVTSAVENPDLLLAPGMTGKAKIYCGRRRIIELILRRIVRFIRVEFWL